MQFRNLLINVKNLLIINVILLVICVIAYVLIFVFWGFLEDRASYLPSVLLTTFSIFITAIITLLVSITIGGFYETYRRFQKLGIQDAEPARRGRETQETDKWLDRLVNAKKSITLVGVSLGGWFITGWPDLKSDLPRILSDISLFEIFLLDPTSEGFQVRVQDEIIGGEQDDPHERVITVLIHIKSFFVDDSLRTYLPKIKFYFYTGTPLSIVQVDQMMYMAIYLPGIPDKKCPQLVLRTAGDFSDKIQASVAALRINAHPIESAVEIETIISRLRSQMRNITNGN